MKTIYHLLLIITLFTTLYFGRENLYADVSSDIVIVGATPAGLGAGISAARLGRKVVIIELPGYFGGLMTNGLGRTDFVVKECAGGIFKEFTAAVHKHYIDTYGQNSKQERDCHGGYFFEPHVATKVWKNLVKREKNITILYNHRFAGVVMQGDTLAGVKEVDLTTKKEETYYGAVVIDATYEGDVAAAAGVPCRVGRESRSEYNEPHAGKTYIRWGTIDPLQGSTGEGDKRVQAYNFRLCMTTKPENMVIISKPEQYNDELYLSAVDDIKSGKARSILDFIFPFPLPNEKYDVNNQHRARISTDYPEENFTYPEATYDEREIIIEKHKNYIRGLFWFLQQDKRVPYEFRKDAMNWGLARDEFTDTGHFPRQIYVREARRIIGEYIFTENDAQQAHGQRRTKIFHDAIAVGDYNLDSHATHKREENHPEALEGFWGLPVTFPYQIPYRIMIPKKVENLLVPVAVSATHVGISTIRMEPVWLSLGQAAGTAAHVALVERTTPRKAAISLVQHELIKQGQVLTVFFDVPQENGCWAAAQYLGTKGLFKDYFLNPDEPVSPEEHFGITGGVQRLFTGSEWQNMADSGLKSGDFATRGELIQKIYLLVKKFEGVEK